MMQDLFVTLFTMWLIAVMLIRFIVIIWFRWELRCCMALSLDKVAFAHGMKASEAEEKMIQWWDTLPNFWIMWLQFNKHPMAYLDDRPFPYEEMRDKLFARYRSSDDPPSTV